jgi:hypothetical protein
VRTILVSLTLLLTVVSSVSLGVGFAYAAIQWILHIFAPDASEASEPAAVLMAQEATAERG